MTDVAAQSAPETTSYAVRAELEELLERDLLGPVDGPTEELPPKVSPSERYLLGRLLPRRGDSEQPTVGAPSDPDDSAAEARALEDDPALYDAEVTAAVDEIGADLETTAQLKARSMAASSLGMSFRVPAGVTRLSVTAAWGRYEKASSEHHETEQGRAARVWARRPMSHTHELQLTTGKHEPVTDIAGVPGVVLAVTVKPADDGLAVDIALVNDQGEVNLRDDAHAMFQSQLSVTALDGHEAVFLGHNDPSIPRRPVADPEREHLALLHRRTRDYAHGRQCAVDAEVRVGDDRAWQLRTTCFPGADVKLTVPADEKVLPGVVLDMSVLGGGLTPEELLDGLTPLHVGYRAWLAQQREQLLSDVEAQRYGRAADTALARADALCERLGRAIDFLRRDGVAREAFRFANQAMAAQRLRSELVRERAKDPTLGATAALRRVDRPENRSWRPFQLAFVLLCLPGLTDPSHPDAHRGPSEGPDAGEVQLLFFPTGGGKTEAYLGLTAYTFAIRRLQGVVGTGAEARDGRDGVAVLMRYTLRLLTAQQFQRATALICACEQLRLERVAAGESRWGGAPFRIGLWVGSSVTPNSFEEAKRQVEDKKDRENPAGGPLQLIVCPWCGEKLTGESISTDAARRRVLLHCADPDGRCVFTRRHSPDGLPVLTVDEEIYRLTPSLIIGTVDKFAQLPWKAATTSLFGNVSASCSRHGWMSPDSQSYCSGTHQATRVLPRTTPETSLPLRAPDLIIQDELHLISDALGSMVGLYETAIDHLATRVTDGRSTRPVIVASTATVRRAEQQVRQVFDRGLAVFPPQVLDAGETFFSTVKEPSQSTPSRRYRGICAPGERLKSVEIRVASALLEHGQDLFNRYGASADPYMTLVDYFTSTRELAGMRRLVEDDIADRLSSQRLRTYRRRPSLAELTSRMPSSRIAGTLADIEVPFDPAWDTNDAAASNAKSRAAGIEVPKRESAYPVDVLLATSMLQVGVDVQRLGLMVVTGQPKNTAEYIQASSRVGRNRRAPGLVVTIYQWTRPRDLAHYETFEYDHATFGMTVEGLTTTPFSDRAMDRGLSAVVATLIRHSQPAALANDGAQRAEVDGEPARRLLDIIGERAGRVTGEHRAAVEARGATQQRLDSWAAERSRVRSGVLGYDVKTDVENLLHKPDEEDWRIWTAPMSLREVEPEVLLQLRLNRADDEPEWTYASGSGQ